MAPAVSWMSPQQTGEMPRVAHHVLQQGVLGVLQQWDGLCAHAVQ
jgi:hypothetical protein